MKKQSIDESNYFGVVHAITNVEKDVSNPMISEELDESTAFDFLHFLKTKDLPNKAIELVYGEPMTLMRNINTSAGIVKNKRCRVIGRSNESVIVEFEDERQIILPKIA